MTKSIKYDETEYFSVSDYKPVITYAGDIELFKKLETILIQALPQESTEWSRKYGRCTKTVTLSTVFKPFSENSFQDKKHYHLLEQPVLHVFWTQCADIEIYKTVLHDEIKEWFQILNQHDVFDDWLIVVVEANDFRRHNKLLSRTTVLDKIKNDFGVKRIDRCLSVVNPLKSEIRTGSSWRALIVNMRLLILTAYDHSLLKFEEFIRKQRENRNQPGWNFCDYFLLQEELAFALEMLGLYEDALIQYDELEALFNQFIRNSSLTDAPEWLSSFQIPIDHWRSISLTCKVNRSFREAIKNNSISLLDFRCYLFCRQAAMLLFICRPWDIAQRTLPFIHYCLNEIRILEIHYPLGAIACWIFSCCLEIIFKCQNFNETAQVDACSLYTAPLMELAIFKLRELGEICGLMPDCEQTSEQLHTVVGLSAGIGDPLRFLNFDVVNPIDKLKEALSSKEAYCKYYFELCEQAMITYKHKGRMRSARYIGKQLADFCFRTGDLSRASGFLVNALSLYEEDNWSTLTNQMKLQLLRCYEQMNEIEKLLRTSISIACSPNFDLPFQKRCLNDILKLLQTESDIELTAHLEEGFIIESIIVEIEKPGLRVHATLNIINKFSSDIICSNISISVSDCSSNNIQKIKECIITDSENIILKNFKNNTKINVLSELPLVYVLDYQQDKSFAGVQIICKNSEDYLRRQDSQKSKKAGLPTKIDYSKAFICKNILLKPGYNSVTLVSQEEESDGTYCLGQLSVGLLDKLYFLSNSNYLTKVKYTIKSVPPKISIESANGNTLLVGIKSSVNLCINMGTYIINENTVVKVRTSDGLKIGLSKDKDLQDETEIFLRCNNINPENIFSIPLILRSEFPAEINDSVADYEIWLKCPWSESEVSLTVQFYIPFIVARRIHTAKLRKFLLISISRSIKESVILESPELSVVSKEDILIKSLNPSAVREFIVYNKTKVKFLWELISSSNIVDKIILCFTVKYNVLNETSVYKCEFQISNFMTLYSIESTIDPMRGCEYCRVNTMCHLVFTVKKVAPTTDHSLKYEVVTDQTVWAVCNMSTGVIILDETDKCSKIVDLMPLVHGYLPLPSIKLSKYFPAETNIGPSPRLEPFYHGQVFNSTKSTQVQVLPSTNLPDF